jgi:hypothetical protein
VTAGRVSLDDLHASEFQPRWLICARTLGVHPRDLRGSDYIRWNNRMVAAYQEAHGRRDLDVIRDHNHLTRWLDQHATNNEEAQT